MVSDAAKKKAAAKRLAAVTKHGVQKPKPQAVTTDGISPNLIDATQHLALSEERQSDQPSVRPDVTAPCCASFTSDQSSDTNEHTEN